MVGSMGIEKVIKLVIKILTWFYQKWLSKFKITSANKIELWHLKKIQHSASALVFNQKPNIFQSSKAECENAASIIHCIRNLSKEIHHVWNVYQKVTVLYDNHSSLKQKIGVNFTLTKNRTTQEFFHFFHKIGLKTIFFLKIIEIW